MKCLWNASVAQSVEQGTENPRVGGSIPPGGTIVTLFMREWLSGRASPCQGERREFESRLPLHYQETRIASLDLPKISIRNIIFNIRILNIYVRRHGQVVRHRSATPLFPSSNLGGASKNRQGSLESCRFYLLPIPSSLFPKNLSIFGK